ncbi:MAG: hypothetical protein Q8L55_08370 [Phycisphaerales bacterium]|nr:hypothetical protein [Phycisphaerales bacterium]
MFRTATLLTLAAVLASTSACSKSDAPTKPAAKAAVAPLPGSYFLAEAPADAKDIRAAKRSLKAGDKVVLIGRIGGSEDPFVPERAIFTLVDKAMKTCDEGSDMDTCKTPWDYCCDPREQITANSAVVQIVGPDGQPLKAVLNGVKGLKPQATVTVVGTVSKAEGQNVVVNATGLFVKP